MSAEASHILITVVILMAILLVVACELIRISRKDIRELRDRIEKLERDKLDKSVIPNVITLPPL